MSEEMHEPEESENKDKQEKEKRSLIHYLIEFAIYLVLIAGCILWVPEHVIQRTRVDGESMSNTLHTGDNLLVEKVSYHFKDPKRYDIIVFHPKGTDAEKYYVKRIYGLPGETIQIIDNQIYINGEAIADDYAKEGIDDPGIADEPITLADDEYFVLGDNRGGSTDSRDSDLGPIKKKSIAGHVILRIWPFNQFGIP